MKKIIPVFLALVLAFSNVVIVKAENPQFFKFYSFQSVYGCLDNVDNYGRSNADKNLIVQCLYQKDQSFYNDFYNSVSSFPSSALEENDLFVGFYYNGSVNIVCCDSNKADFLVYSNGYYSNPQANGQGTKLYFCYKTKSGYSSYIPSVYTFLNNQWANSSFINNSGSGYTYFFESYAPLLFSNAKIVIYDDLPLIGHTPPSGEGRNYAWLYQNDLFDYSSVSLNANYTDSSGTSHAPDPEVEIESNANHMYFQDCEIGFCYPKSSPAPVSFGGAYFYIKYQVDDWIVNHISDYNLVFYADAEVGNEVTNTIRYEIALDPDGCITIPFSRIWSTPLISKGFSVLVTDREIEDNFYKSYLYSLSPSGFVNFGNKAAASNQNSISGALSALASGGIQSFLYYINGDQIDFYSALSDVATSIAVKYNPYLINAFTLLTDGEDNSGLFEMQFDLVTGTEDVTDTGGLVNPDPFVPEDDPDFTPPAPTPGNSTTPGYNIVPSGFWQGTMNAVIGYDPGYRDLKNDVNSDPDGNFSQYLDPMHNDDVGSWFMSFVNEMPTEMKSILIAGVGVGVLFGLYRFIRRG